MRGRSAPPSTGTRRSLHALAVVAVLGLLLWVLGGLFDVVLLVFVGSLIGLFLHGIGSWLARKTHLPERLWVAVFCLAILGLAVLTGWLAAPSVANQGDALTETLPRAFEKATEPFERHGWGRALLKRARHPGEIIARRETWSNAGGVLFATLGVGGSLIVVLFIGLYTGFDPGAYRRGLLRLVPHHRRERVAEITSLVAHTLQMWMVGKLVSMMLVGVATWIGLALLDIPLALLLALLAALLTFIPNFGPVLSAVPAILLALLQGPTKALWVVGLYIAIQTVESYLFTPLLQKRMVALPPALTIVAQLVMGTIAGALGVVVATPLTAAFLVLVKEAYVKDVLGDQAE